MKRPASRALILGVDGGGSKTRAILANPGGRIVATGTAGSSNTDLVGVRRAMTAIEAAVSDAFERAGRAARRPVAAACFGLAAVDTADDRTAMERRLRRRRIAGRLIVVNDAELVLAAGARHGVGVALIAGTGSICLGRTAEGAAARVGGWGHLLGDEGSGYRIAEEALSLATQTADGRRRATAILRAVLDHWRLANAEELLARIYESDVRPTAIAGVVPRIFELAHTGDRHAAAIVRRAAGHLARLVDTLVRRLKLRRPPLALGGSLLTQSRMLREHMLAQLTCPVGPVTIVRDPARGAVRLARALLKPR